MKDRLSILTSLSAVQIERLVSALREPRPKGRPWGLSPHGRMLLVCTALRTNLTFRELAAIFQTSKSSVHRIVDGLCRRIGRLRFGPRLQDRRFSWVLDGTLVPTRDHSAAAKSKNYRWSCNVQVLVRRHDLRVIAIGGGGPGNRNDPLHYRASSLPALCRRHGRVLADGGYRGIPELKTPIFEGNRIRRDAAWRIHRKKRARVEHALARMKNWRILRDHRRKAGRLLETVRAVAVLHNIQMLAADELRDNS